MGRDERLSLGVWDDGNNMMVVVGHNDFGMSFACCGAWGAN